MQLQSASKLRNCLSSGRFGVHTHRDCEVVETRPEPEFLTCARIPSYLFTMDSTLRMVASPDVTGTGHWFLFSHLHTRDTNILPLKKFYMNTLDVTL